MFKEGEFVQHNCEKDMLYKIRLDMGLGFYWIEDDAGWLRLKNEKDLTRWEPNTPLEKWMSWDFKKRWSRYKSWKAIAERRGITVEQLFTDVHPYAIVYLKKL